MDRRGIVVVVAGGNNFDEREFREMFIKQHTEENEFPITTEILAEEKLNLPEIIFEHIEETEAKQEKFFEKISYQQQQKDLRFLNKRRKSN